MGLFVPECISAGVSFALTVCARPYVAPDWDLLLYLRGPAVIDLTAADDGTAHKFTADAATTAAWAAGEYAYTLRATNGADVVEVESGRLTVLADIATATGAIDNRSHAEKTLAAIEAVIERRASQDQQRYRIDNRELWRTPESELMKFRAFYREEVRRERLRRNGKSQFGSVKFTMGPTR